MRDEREEADRKLGEALRARADDLGGVQRQMSEKPSDVQTMEDLDAELMRMMEDDDLRCAIQIAVRESDGVVLQCAMALKEGATPEYMARVLRRAADRLEAGAATKVST